MQRGSILEAEYYFRSGFELASASRSQYFISIFRLKLAELYRRSRRLDEAVKQWEAIKIPDVIRLPQSRAYFIGVSRPSSDRLSVPASGT